MFISKSAHYNINISIRTTITISVRCIYEQYSSALNLNKNRIVFST